MEQVCSPDYIPAFLSSCSVLPKSKIIADHSTIADCFSVTVNKFALAVSIKLLCHFLIRSKFSPVCGFNPISEIEKPITGFTAVHVGSVVKATPHIAIINRG